MYDRTAYSADNAAQKLKLTFMYVFFGIVSAMIGAAVLIPYAAVITGPILWGLIAVEFGLLFLFMFNRNIYTFLLFTFSTGLVLAPLLGMMITIGKSAVILQALMGTAVITGGMTLYAATTKNDHLGWGPALFWILIGMIAIMIMNIFIGSSILSMAISMAVVALFSAFIVYDVQTVLRTNVDPLDAAMSIYLDVLNIFVHLLHILGGDSD